MEDIRKFIFQPIDWRYNSETEKDDKKCIITVGGVLENGEDIVCEIYNFKPHIVIELPQEIIRNEETIPIIWTEQLYEKIYNWMRELISDKSDKNQKNRPVKYEILDNVKVYQQQRQGNFIKIYFMTHISMAGFRRCFEDKIDDEYVSHSIYCGIFQTIFPAGTFKLHETNINPLIKFIVKQKIIPSGWIEVTEYIPRGSIGCTANERKFSHAIHDCYVYAEDVHPANEKVDATFRPNIKVMSFDIECFSKNFNSKMPDFSIPENEVYSIGACIANVTDQAYNYKTYILSLENPPDIPGVTMLRFKTERDLLIGFGKFIRDNENPYIMLGHNILGFDWDYLIKRTRLAINDCYSQFAEFTKMIDEEADCTKLSWNSRAYHDMVFKYMNPVGRLNFDLMVEAERQGYRLKSFALNSLGEKFLGEFKKDLPYRHQFMIYFLIIRTRRMKSLKKCRKLIKKTIKHDECMDENMNITEIGEWKAKLLDCSADAFRSVIKEGHSLLLEYLKQDVILPMKIFHKMNMWTGAQQASNIFRVPIEYLQTRGQQIKVLAQLYALASEESTILGFKQYERQYDWNIQGALVQDIIKGYHEHVLTYDFTSLYPSIIMAFNISYDSFVEDLNVDPETVHIIDWPEHKFCGCPEDPKNGKKGKNDRILCSKNENIGTEYEGHFRFQFKKVVIIRDEKGNIIERRYEGLFPGFLRNLLTERKGIKKQVKIINKWVYGTDFGSKAAKEKIANWVVGGDEIESYTKYCSTAQISKEDLEFIRLVLPKTIHNKPILTKENIHLLLITLVVLDKKQLAVKISANSGYGGLGTETSALCFKPGAACTTAMGRKLITKGIEHTRKTFTAEKLSEIFEHKVDDGFKLVYGDTDSFMGCFPALTISESWKMIDHIQKELDSGIFPEPIHLEFECMYGKYFQLSKKCYVSWMMEPKVKNVIDDDVKNNWMITDKLQKGVVSSRRDNCRYTTYGFDKLMDMAINDVKTKYEMRNYVADYAYQLMSKGIETKDLIVTKGVGYLEDYEKEDEEGNTTLTNQGHIKLAAKMMHLRGEDVQNTRLQFMFIKRPSEKIRFVDLKQEHVIEDATYYKNKFRKLGLEPYYLYYLTHTIESHFDKILDYKYKPITIYHEKIVDKLEKEREVLESKIHYSKLHFLNNLLVPVSQTIKIPFLNKDPIKYKLYRQTFLITEHVKVIEQQLNLKSESLNMYIHLLKQRHSANIIKRIQDIYGFTQHGGGERGDKENNHVMIDGTYTKKLIKAHVKYRNVVKDLNNKFVRLNFVDPYKD